MPITCVLYLKLRQICTELLLSKNQCTTIHEQETEKMEKMCHENQLFGVSLLKTKTKHDNDLNKSFQDNRQAVNSVLRGKSVPLIFCLFRYFT